MTTNDALISILIGQAAQGRQLDRIEAQGRRIMALSVTEQAAVTGLAADIEALGAAVKVVNAGLTKQIADVTALRDALQAKDDVDVAAVAAANVIITGLQSTLDAQSADVVGALGGLDARVKTLTPPAP